MRQPAEKAGAAWGRTPFTRPAMLGLGLVAMAAATAPVAGAESDGEPAAASPRSAEPAAARNLAAGAKYTCDPPPDYWGWKNPVHGDHGQLTDGVIHEAWQTTGEPFYAQPSSMGWSNMAPAIVFDLGEPRSIHGIAIHSCLSPYGPWWPCRVAVLVSSDNRHFQWAGPELVPSPEQFDPPLTAEAVQAAIDRVMEQKGLSPSMHWSRHEGLNAVGRYVALLMTRPPDTGSIVIDEIEIHGSAAGPVPPAPPGQHFTEGTGGAESYRLYRAIDQRLAMDIAALRAKIEGAALDAAAGRRLLEELAAIDARRSTMPVGPIAGFQAVLPVNELHADLFAVHAALWRAQGAPPLRVWKTHRWDPLAPLQDPAGGTPQLAITMAGNAVGGDVLNIANAGDSADTISVVLRDLPAEHLELCEVPLVDTQEFVPVAGPLVPIDSAGGQHEVGVASGMTRQVWLRCSSKAMAPGRHEGSIQLTSGRHPDWSADVPVSIEVLPVRMPDRFTLHVGGWEYAWAGTYQVTERNLDDYLALLHDYGVNTTWAASPFAFGKHDEAGALVEPPSRRGVDEWLQRWPVAALYCAVCFELPPMDAPNRDRLLEAWARDWSQYLRTRGVEPERVALLLRDEPTQEAELKLILETGRAIKRGEPRFKIWNDIHYPDPNKAPPVLDDLMREACDIQCFNTQHYNQAPESTLAFMQRQARPGLEWWTYSGGANHRLTDPYIAWLLRFWFCFDLGLNGAQFWAFGDGNGGFSWNEYLNIGPTRSPLYLAPEGVVPAKAMEAMREGAQDFELLTMLQARARHRGEDDTIRQLREDVKRVLAAHTSGNWLWQVPKDRSVADEVRTKVLRALAVHGQVH